MDTAEAKLVPFTQYILPNGRREQMMFETDEAHATKAAIIREHGFEFEIEVLGDGAVSATIADHLNEEDVEICIASNGPPIAREIEKMIDRFHAVMGERQAGDSVEGEDDFDDDEPAF